MALRNILAPRQQVLTAAGNPLAGGKVFLFEPGSTTPVTSFRDSGLVVPHTHPIRLSGSARANIWITRDVDMFITDRNSADIIPTNIVVEELNANPDALGADEAGGLVPNGSFEIDTDADLVPDGYTLSSEAGATNELDTAESTDGAQSFRFTSSGAGGGSLVTDDFFPVNDVDPLRVNVDLRSSVAAVRNIVRVEWYDVSQVSISNSDAYDSTANPAVYTTQNLSVIPPALARFAKIRLIGIDPSVLLAGSTFFDRLSVFYPAVVTGVFDNITIQNNEIITTNLNGDLNLRPNGTGAVVLDFNGAPVISTAANSMRLRTDINTATPPVAEAVTGLFQVYDADGSDPLAQLGFSGSNQLDISNLMHGGALLLSGQDAAGVTRSLIQADPDGETILYNAGNDRFQTGSDQVSIRRDDNLDTSTLLCRFQHDNGSSRGLIGYVGSGSLQFANQVHGSSVILSAEDSGGATRTILTANPDAVTTLRGDTDLQLEVNAGELALLATANAGVEMYYNNAVRLLTETSGDVGIRSNSSPGIGFAQAVGLNLEQADGVVLAVLDFAGDTAVRLKSFNHGGQVLLQSEDAGGVSRNILVGDPDGNATLYNAGNPRLIVDSNQVSVRRDDNLDTSTLFLRLEHNDGTDRALYGFSGTDTLRIRNEVHGGLVSIELEDAGGVIRNGVVVDPDSTTAGVELFTQGSGRLRTIAAGNGGAEVNNTLTGGGYERVLTESDILGLEKASNETTISDIVLSNDADLSLISLPAGTYEIEYMVVFYATTTASMGFQYRLDVGGTLTRSVRLPISRRLNSADDTVKSIGGADQTISTSTISTSSGDPDYVYEKATIVTSTVGTVAIQWAQNSSTGNNLNVLAGSYIKARRLTS